MYGAKSVNTRAIKNVNAVFLDKGSIHVDEKRSPPCGRAEIKNVKKKLFQHFQFQLCH